MSRLSRYLRYLSPVNFATIVFIFIAVFPMYWAFVTSMMTTEETFSWPPKLFPSAVHLSYFAYLITHTPVFGWMVNTFIVAVLTLLFSVPASVLAGYGLYKYLRFRGRSWLIRFLFLVITIPPTVVIIPYYLMVDSWGLADSLLGLAITYIVFTLPINVMVYFASLFSIPREIQESAMVDGCSTLEAFVRVVLPLSKIGIIAISVLTFTVAWNEFAFALTLLRTPSKWTAVIGLRSFVAQWTLDWNSIMLSAIIFTIPVIIFYFITQKYFVEGMTKGALKF